MPYSWKIRGTFTRLVNPIRIFSFETQVVDMRTRVQQKLLTKNGNTNKCDYCSKIFDYASRLKRHMNVHSGERGHRCQYCLKGFSQRENLETHTKSHYSVLKPYRCRHCGKAFAHKSTFENHRQSHVCWSENRAKVVQRGPKSGYQGFYNCQYCKTTFDKKVDLVLHRQDAHFDKKKRSYKCNNCDKHFYQGGNLKMHQRIHDGIKSYKCDECGRLFSQRGSLGQHRRVHDKDTPYWCRHCPKGFSQASNRIRHERSRHG